MSDPPQIPYEPKHHYAHKSGESFRGIVASHGSMDLSDWDVDGADVVGYSNWGHQFPPVSVPPIVPSTGTAGEESVPLVGPSGMTEKHRLMFMADLKNQQWPMTDWGEMDDLNDDA